MKAMAIIATEFHLVPCIELEREEDVQFEVEMGPFTIDSSTGIPHASNDMSGRDTLPFRNISCGKVSIEAQKWAVTPVVLDNDVFPVIASSGTFLDINNPSECDGSDIIKRATS